MTPANDNLTEWQAYLAKMDRDNLDPAGDLWLPAFIFGLVAFIGGVAFYVGTAL